MKKGDLAKQKYEELEKMAPTQAEALLKWIQQGKKKSASSGPSPRTSPQSPSTPQPPILGKVE